MATSDRRRAAPGPQRAYVLHSYDWSESSLILDLYTRDEGRQVVVAKGAKRPYSQLRAVLLPFQAVLVQLSRSASSARESSSSEEVRTLRTAEWAAGAGVLGGQRLFSGFYLNELLMKFLPRGEPHTELFDVYQGTLQALSQCSDEDDARLQSLLRAFELHLLREVGFLPDLAQETLTGRALKSEAPYRLVPELGLQPCLAEDPMALNGQAWVALQAALLARHGPALEAAAAQARMPLRLGLRSLLQYHLSGATLRTREVMQDLQKLEPES